MYVQRLQQSYVVNGMINTKTLKQHHITDRAGKNNSNRYNLCYQMSYYYTRTIVRIVLTVLFK